MGRLNEVILIKSGLTGCSFTSLQNPKEMNFLFIMSMWMVSILINPLVTNGLSHPLDEFILIFRDTRGNFSFLDEIPVSKQNNPKGDPVLCSSAILFAYVR